MTTRIVLVRHGETEFNADGRLQGQMDVPLSARGVSQAEAVAPVIARATRVSPAVDLLPAGRFGV